jgi:hypothetical protein
MSAEANGRVESGGVRRFGGILLLGISVGILVLGVFAFDRFRIARSNVEKTKANMERALIDAKGRERLVIQNRALVSAAKNVQKRAELTTNLPTSWGERQINLRQQTMSRDLINPLMLSLVRGDSQLFKLDEFELAVSHPEAGLFDLGVSTQVPLVVSLRGSIYFRIAERPL